ncbi:hypothetical protein ACK8N7_33620 [Streptomyces griseobrunneus]|uniref:hypothetical protein n=1 Tax=Streptomyces microflavus TaxID=1919 RepID=UPI0038074189
MTFFGAAAPVRGEMTAAVEAELSRELRAAERRRLFGRASEFHLRHNDVWTDLLRSGSPSRKQDLKRASHEATLRTV